MAYDDNYETGARALAELCGTDFLLALGYSLEHTAQTVKHGNVDPEALAAYLSIAKPLKTPTSAGRDLDIAVNAIRAVLCEKSQGVK